MSQVLDEQSAKESGTSFLAGLPRSSEGYEPAATEQLVGELNSKHAELELEREELGRRVEELEADLARYQAQEHLVSRAIITATKHAETIREEARREAEVILQKSSREALARETASQHERAAVEREVARLRQIADGMQTSLRSILTGSLERLRVEADGEAADPQTSSIPEALGVALDAARQREGAGQDGADSSPSGGDPQPGVEARELEPETEA